MSRGTTGMAGNTENCNDFLKTSIQMTAVFSVLEALRVGGMTDSNLG
jgi:hypothetical protein